MSVRIAVLFGGQSHEHLFLIISTVNMMYTWLA